MTQKSDIFSLGVIYYNMIYGKTPTMVDLQKIKNNEFPQNI